MLKFILASESPRRKALLEQIGIKFDVVIPDIDENINEATPDKLVSRLSQMKAESVCKSNKTDIVIAADTVVCLSDGRVLNKPMNEKRAYSMLSELSGRFHFVYTGLTVAGFSDNAKRVFDTGVCRTKVIFNKLSHDDINDYIRTKEPMDKAGAYGIQGIGAKFVKAIEGDYSSVVGLPLSMLYEKIKKYLKE